jgi:hypothetical protein
MSESVKKSAVKLVVGKFRITPNGEYLNKAVKTFGQIKRNITGV